MPCYDADFYPFGGEAAVATNTCSQNYKFTGKERDSESGLDCFGARHHSSSLGRFMSVDPSRLSVRLYDPQTWNRYSYARNNPLNFVDRNGKWSTRVHEEIIDAVFAGILSVQDRSVLKQASKDVDEYQSPDVAYMHGMRSKDETAYRARRDGETFIAEHLDEAVSKQMAWERSGHKGYSPDALYDFGTSLHTVTDAESPFHDHWRQVWGDPWEHPFAALGHSIFETLVEPIADESIEEAKYQANRLWDQFQDQLAAQREVEKQEAQAAEQEQELEDEEDDLCGDPG